MVATLLTRPGRPRALAGIGIAIAVLIVLQAFAGVGGDAGDAVAFDWAPIAVYVLAAAGCVLPGRRPRAERLPWLVMGAGIALYAGGSLVWVAGDPDRPVAEAPLAPLLLWLAFYGMAYVALGLLLRARLRHFHPTFWLDGVIGALVIAALCATFLVPALHVDPTIGTAELLAGLSYAAADVLLLLMTLAAIGLSGRGNGRGWVVLGLGFLVLAAGDVVLALQVAADTYDRASLVTAAFPAAMLLLAIAAHQPTGPSRPLRIDSPIALAMPFACSVVTIGLLAFEAPLDLSPAARLLALLALCVGVVRAVVTVLELGSLSESRRFERGFQDAAIGMALVALDLRTHRVNDRLCRLLGRTSAELTGAPLSDLAHPDDRARLAALADGTGEPLELRLLRPDGTVIDALVTAALVGDDGPDAYLFAQIEDVTARRRAERQTAAAAELGRQAIRIHDVGALMAEAVAVTTTTLGTSAAFVGRCSEPGSMLLVATTEPPLDGQTVELGERTTSAEIIRCGVPVVSNDIAADPRFEAHALVVERHLTRVIGVPIPRRADGSYVIVVHRTAHEPPFTPEDARFVEAVANTVATALDRADVEAETRHRALHDPLTGLANRSFLHGQVEQALAGARRDHRTVAVLLLDVDRFKLVNDTIGHGAGDIVLREVADRLRMLVRAGDVAARLGGDEFVIACSGVAGERDVAALAGRIVAAFDAPFPAGGREWQLGASVGVALGGAGTSADDLLRDADLAMYRAKDGGGARFEVFDAEMRTRVVERLALEADLRRAVEQSELALHYQPLVNLGDGRLEGFEALLRWEHPEHGLVPPGDFIPIAEETDLIRPIGRWVLRTACEQVAAWNDARPDRRPVHVRVNLSPRQLTPALPATVAAAIRDSGIAPSQLTLEITERLLVEEPAASAILGEVRALGVSVALDDFGTGYASLSYLKSYPVDVLKLDRSLIAELGTTREATAIVKAAVDMAQALGLCVVGEGIEEVAQAAELRRLGCGLGQGWLFAPALPAAEAEALLAAPAPFATPA